MTNFIIVAAVILLVIAWRVIPPKGVRMISTAELKNILKDQDKLFIDVRTNGEFRQHHIQQFKNMPLGTDLSTLSKDKEIVVICQSGMRSMTACKQLKKQGFEKVTNVRGGMSMWRG